MKSSREMQRDSKLLRATFYELVSSLNKKSKSSTAIHQSKGVHPHSLKPYRSIRELKTLLSQQKSRHHCQKPPPFRHGALPQNRSGNSSTLLQKDDLVGIIKLKLHRHRPLANKKQNQHSGRQNESQDFGLFRVAKSSANSRCVAFDSALNKERSGLVVRNSRLLGSSLGRREARMEEVVVSLTERPKVGEGQYPIRSITSNGRYDGNAQRNVMSSRDSVRLPVKAKQVRGGNVKEISGWQVDGEQEGFIFEKEEIRRKIKQICK